MYFRQDSESRGEIGSFPHRKSTLVSCIADSLPTEPPRKPITLKTKVKNACPYWMKSKNFFFLGKPSGPIKRSWDSKWHLKVLKKKKKKKIWFLSNYQKKAPFTYTHTHTHTHTYFSTAFSVLLDTEVWIQNNKKPCKQTVQEEKTK